jgi:hypothetical protein
VDAGFLCSKATMLDVGVKRKTVCIIGDSYSAGEVKMRGLQCKWYSGMCSEHSGSSSLFMSIMSNLCMKCMCLIIDQDVVFNSIAVV